MRSTCYALAVAAFSFAPSAQAGVIININQVGSDVVATGSGTLNVTGLTVVGGASGADSSQIDGPISGVLLGPTAGGSDWAWNGAVGPAAFASGSVFFANSGSGPVLGIQGLGGDLYTPPGYISGTFLSSTDTWSNTTLAALGLIPGTYVYTWNSGVTTAGVSTSSLDDSVTVNIGTPEPASICLLGAGLLALGLRRLRRAA